MKKLKDFITKWQNVILVSLFCFLYLGQCSNNRAVSKLRSENKQLIERADSLTNVIKNNVPITRKEIRDEMEEVMFDYLVYEDDLDKGKTTLSQIKNQISK